MSRPRATGWAADLALGARLVFAGGRNGLLRTLMTALGVGLGVALLLTSTSVSTMLDARSERTAARDDQFIGVDQPPPGDRTLLVTAADTVYRDEAIRGRLLQPDGAHPPVPPGLTRLPGPGELVVSPALARLLDSPDGALLRPRLDHPVVGTIADQGLSGPNEYAYYLGTDQLRPGGGTLRIDHFGAESSAEGLDPVLMLLVLIIFVVLLLPIAVFIAAAVRFGGEARDRRLAALRLVGADAVTTRRVAAGEALVGALFGLLGGAAFFLLGRQLVERVTLEGISVFAGDVRPSPALAVLIVLAVPAVAVAVAQLALRRVVVEPLGVVRRSANRRRRLWWRLTLPIVGVVLLAPLRGGIDQTGGPVNQAQVITGVVLLLVGVAALLPWLVEAVVRRLRGGSVSWQLAIRRLQLDSESSARMVSGVAVAVAGAIALQMLFAGVQHGYVRATGQDVSRAQTMVLIRGGLGGADAGSLAERFRTVPGVDGAVGVLDTTVSPVGSAPDEYGERPATLLRIADCAALRELASPDRCVDGDMFRIVDEQSPEQANPPAPGQEVEIGFRNPENTTRWTVPTGLRTVPGRTDPAGNQFTGLLATPGALDPTTLRGLGGRVYLGMDLANPDTIELVRNVAAGFGPAAQVQTLRATEEVTRFGQIRRGLYVGVVATLLLLGASLLVGILEQLRERRRSLAVLVAFGTRRGTLSASVLWQTAVPVLLGLALAIVLGTALGGILLTLVSQPVRLDWPSIGTMSGIAAGVVLLVTGASLPVLWRLLRPTGLRTE
ncbi:ABC transporter permease [Plantactinospora sp. KLBMP9567]|uniref:ABC transporter permease n=1 Tax=Plantactinospora sp. KLBMP9567 TaxID=3085900 RepID=UPI002981BA43|nr:ABC transporter permease [Plantactinospora sp. KLBMP9567]MDW5326072.1 ABC transporter permease [Plantactinospora sp. KLBMP9567]